MTVGLVVSCEHATAAIPARFRPVFRGADRALASHRGSDIGARQLARELARVHGAPLVEARASRLLVDANRSRGHRQLFSEWSRGLDPADRELAIERYWQPPRAAVEDRVTRLLRRHAAVVHVSVHSFTPIWDGVPRTVDVGLLYDPARSGEVAVAKAWLAELAGLAPDLHLRRNQPYRGTADGLTRTLRRTFDAERYIGIELEVSQRFPLGPASAWRSVRAAIVAALPAALAAAAHRRPATKRRRRDTRR